MRKSVIAAAALALAIAGCGGGTAPSGQSAPSAPSGKSDSYKAGYASGMNGNARNEAALANHRDACLEGYQEAIGNQVHPWDENDFVEGCMQALQDHPPN